MSYTASAPGHPLLSKVLEYVFSFAARKSKESSSPNDDEVLQITGPLPWTNAIHDSWRELGIDPASLRNWGSKSRQIGDQLIFPLVAFSPGMKSEAYFGTGSLDDPNARVQHLFCKWFNE